MTYHGTYETDSPEFRRVEFTYDNTRDRIEIGKITDENGHLFADLDDAGVKESDVYNNIDIRSMLSDSDLNEMLSE